MKITFSMQRLLAIILKEFILIIRDPAVIVIMTILPLVLVCLAGYAVNIYPKKVPTVLINFDQSDITNDLIQRMKNTGYFSFFESTYSNHEAYHLLKTNQALFIVTIPANFTQKLLRHENPAILLEDGGVDALSTGRAAGTLIGLQQTYLQQIKPSSLNYLRQSPPAFRIISHHLYDPEFNSRYQLVPGVLGLVLMLTMLKITTVIVFRDVQEGMIEYLLVSPLQPAEILLGEILSYLIIGYLQLTFGIFLSYYLFHVPLVGNLWLLYLSVLPYIIAELSLGLTIATFCATQFEAIQVNNLFIAISVILTGFLFPLFAMPQWAQYVSHLLPLTYFFKILYGIMLKGNTFIEIWPNIWPLLIYSILMISIAANRFEKHFRQ